MSSSAAAPAQIASTPQSIARTPIPVAARTVVMSRWMRAAASLAAIALLVAISAVVLSNRFGSPDSTVIPAVSDQVGQGPATSSGAVFTTWFEQRFPIDALSSYGVDQWQWVEMVQGMVNPAIRALPARKSPLLEMPCITCWRWTGSWRRSRWIAPESCSARFIRTPVRTLAREPSCCKAATPCSITPLKRSGILRTHEPASVLGTPCASESSGFDPPTGAVRMSVGNGAIPPDFAADATSLEMSLQRVDIQPGETFGYAISPKTIDGEHKGRIARAGHGPKASQSASRSRSSRTNRISCTTTAAGTSR